MRYIFEGSGAAILLILSYVWRQVSPLRFDLTHTLLPTTTVTEAVLIDLLVLIAVCSCLFAWLSRRDRDSTGFVWPLLLVGILDCALSSIQLIAERRFPIGPGKIALLAGAGLMICRYFFPAIYRNLIRVWRGFVLVLGWSILWILPQLAFAVFSGQPHESESFSRQPPRSLAISGTKRRLVWIVFDEMSYYQAFERPGRPALPNFDRLKGESISYSNLQPVGYFTELVIPSWLLDEKVTAIKSSQQGEIRVRLQSSGRWVPFDEHQTIFAAASNLGWTSGIAGWFNPYCRLLSGLVDSCFWTLSASWPGHMSPALSAWANSAQPLTNAVRRIEGKRSPDLSLAEDHLKDVEIVTSKAEMLLRDEHIRFAFIHLPIPHPLGAYDRATHRLRAGGSYLDNLVLADETLGRLLKIIRQSVSFGNTAVVVSSDHSWRTAMWTKEQGWTKDDDAAATRGFDPRPVLLIHLPGQTESVDMASPTQDLVVSSILLRLLRENSWQVSQFGSDGSGVRVGGNGQ